jgi:hypothetical protein
MIDHHTLAIISISGSCLDVLGSLYLAYDLLGGKHGPLRLLTRMVTYSILYGVGFGLGLGPFFGAFSGIGLGVTAAIELNRASSGKPKESLVAAAVFSAIRAAAFGIGLHRIAGVQFAIVFGVAITAGQLVGYSRGITPAMDYASNRRPRFTRRQFTGALVRTFGYGGTALLCGVFVHRMEHPLALAIRLGLVIGILSGIGQSINPLIEYYADNIPERWMGVVGIGLMFCGFLLQSTQYWLQFFDVHLT